MAQKKRKRDRNLWRRPSGIYWLDFTDRHGTRHRHSLETTSRAEAIRRRDAIIAGEVDAKWGKPDTDITPSDFWAEYEAWAKGRVAPVTISGYSTYFRSFLEHAKPATMGSVTSRDIDLWMRHRQAEGKAPKTVNSGLTTLTTLYHFAIREGLLSGQNPAVPVKRVKPAEKGPPKFLTKAEIDRFMSEAEAHSEGIYLFCGLAVFAGLRTKEAGAAEWRWVNFDTGTLTVQASRDGHFTTKGGRHRTIPLHARLRAVLEPRRADTGFIIKPNKDHFGKWRVRYEPKRAFSIVTEAADVPWCTPHILRHTFASQLVQAGVSLFKVSRWLGHADVRTTQIYAHLAPADDEINSF